MIIHISCPIYRIKLKFKTDGVHPWVLCTTEDRHSALRSNVTAAFVCLAFIISEMQKYSSRYKAYITRLKEDLRPNPLQWKIKNTVI